MEAYVFYDTDDSGNAEYDIHGESYCQLMRFCCQYSTVLRLTYRFPNIAIADRLNAFEIPMPKNLIEILDPSYYYSVKYYKVCPELCEILTYAADGIFEWLYNRTYKNPEDPTFFREDGTIFFISEIHEGICAIMPREIECTAELMRIARWLSGDDIRPRDKVWLSKLARSTWDGSTC